ncbi:amidohydrolase family protein [Georgenia alba]|uniref:Amidohydrolase family protein n=1 Tax=Georgenia alba TaxID=2233858 RepID=A0ABW2Q6Y7_9MICO
MIDAHHHYWQVALQNHDWRGDEHAALERDFTPEDLAPLLVDAGVRRTILVESADLPGENDRLARYAAETETVAGVVGWLPLRDPTAAGGELDRSLSADWLGVRCLVGRSPMAWLHSPAAVALMRRVAAEGLAWDVVPVTEEQVEDVLELAARVPDLRIVVDHLARPPLGDPEGRGVEAWRDRVTRMASLPNVAMKVSVGIDALTAWEWKAAELGPILGHAVEAFGVERLMLASNWPVVTLRAGYGQAIGDMVDALRGLGCSAAEIEAVTSTTAECWYRV